MVTKNHYGKRVYSEVPVTGVVHNHTPEWLTEESIYHYTVDLAFEEHLNECPEEDHDLCWESQSGTLLLGSWKRDANGLWEPDQTGEYSAIMEETYTQVVWSKYTKRCALCSPCYPGQADLDTPGEFLAFDVPPELY